MRYTLYFAYGSNMHEPQFAARCPASFFLGRAKLPGHRFIINTCGDASVVPKKGGVVHGVLCALTAADERELDRREGVRQKIYRRAWVEIILDSGDKIPALIYIASVDREGPPRAGYLEKILAGARRHKLPATYLAEIRRWARKA